jgi:hypothetical protein
MWIDRVTILINLVRASHHLSNDIIPLSMNVYVHDRKPRSIIDHNELVVHYVLTKDSGLFTIPHVY